MKTIHSTDDIPKFKSLEEEGRFWDTHQLSEELWATAQNGDPELDRALADLVSVKVITPRTKSKSKSPAKRAG